MISRWLGVAYNGQECLNMLKDKEPDVLVLDIIMPHLDGLGVLERLETIRSSTTECYHANSFRSGRCYKKSS